MQIHNSWYEPTFSEILKRDKHKPILFVVPSISLPQFIREELYRKGLVIQHVAYDAGMTPDGLRAVIHGKRALKDTECRGLADSLNINADMLRAMIERDAE